MAVGKVGALAGILECDQEWWEGHNYGRGDDRHSMPFIGEAEDELSILRSIDRGPGASGQKGVTKKGNTPSGHRQSDHFLVKFW